MYWWLLPALAAIGGGAAWLHAARRRRAAPAGRHVAHSDRLTELREFKSALRRRRAWLTVAIVAGAVFLGATAVAAARPVHRSTVQPELRNRDIVLCLDVSGSMTGTDAAIAGVFEELARTFDGERIGLLIFDSRAVQVFPLTDDYDYVAEQLAEARKALEGGNGPFFDGTWSVAGSSLIGDGLAGCVQSFPGQDDDGRSRSVVLATDNFVSGEPIFTLEQAAELAKRKGVRIHAINPGDFDYGGSAGSGEPQPGVQLKNMAQASGGTYSTLDSADAVPGIVRGVQETEAKAYRAAPQALVSDTPQLPLTLALLAGAGMLVAGWRLQP